MYMWYGVVFYDAVPALLVSVREQCLPHNHLGMLLTCCKLVNSLLLILSAAPHPPQKSIYNLPSTRPQAHQVLFVLSIQGAR
jgi:hypothetical protein